MVPGLGWNSEGKNLCPGDENVSVFKRMCFSSEDIIIGAINRRGKDF
jgi:hypothetical protein